MELISAAIRRSHSRDSGRSGRSESTHPRNINPPTDPIIVDEKDYDDNLSTAFSDDYIYPENYEEILKDNLGKIFINLAQDQYRLAKKCGLDRMSTNIHEICDNFNGFVRVSEEQRNKHSLLTQDDMEKRLIAKQLNSHTLTQSIHPPKYFSPVPVLTSSGRTADIQKLFPNRNNKFSGHPKDNLSLLEFITSMNAAQEYAKLSENEFKQMLLSCTTGPAHQFLIEWMEDSNEDIGSTYHQLGLRFDTRKSAEDARNELFTYKATKDKTLAQIESDIMSLAFRACSIYPAGESRKNAQNLEICNALMRCLPPYSASLVRREYAKLSTDMGKICSATELSRVLNNLRHSIDADIRAHGGEFLRQRGRFPIKTKRINSYASYGLNTAVKPPRPQQSPNNYFRGRGRSVGNHLLANGPRVNYNPIPQRQPNIRGGAMRGTSRGGPRRHFQNKSCSLCGRSDHSTYGSCPNMRDNNGVLVRVHPVQGTCGLCPGNRKNTLHHPSNICPYRIGAPLHNK